MGSQFVDLDADGHLDYLTATFDGSPHVAYGSAEGFGEPEHLLDAEGKRILISSFWNYGDKAHQESGRSFEGNPPRGERCVSAWAYDWDADGDLDLLLGSYANGHLYRQMNEGTKIKPRFTGKNIPVMAGDAHFGLPAKMTALRMVDWDGDGDLDILAGSFGDCWDQKRAGGGVYLSRNVGQTGQPAFDALQTLIAPSQKGQKSPTRPDAGLYADAIDYDGDGDLDLVVGGYSMWTPEGRELSEEEQAEAKRLTTVRDELKKRNSELRRTYSREVGEAKTGKDPESPEVKAALAAARQRYGERFKPLRKELETVTDALDKLIPSPKHAAFVWLYERR